MKEEIRKILTKLETGEISSRKAIKLIGSLDENSISKVRAARKIKITIVDGDEDKKIRLPGLPFWLITLLGNIGVSIAPLAIKHSNGLDSSSLIALEAIKDIDFKEFISTVREYGPFDLVDICDNKDIVKISVL